jgi:hypothetical protein
MSACNEASCAATQIAMASQYRLAGMRIGMPNEIRYNFYNLTIKGEGNDYS